MAGLRTSRSVLNIGLTALAGSVLQSRPFQPTSAMNPFSRPNRLILPPRTAFRPGGTLFSRKTAAPFRPVCSMNASGWLIRRPGWPISDAGCSTARSWTQVRQPGRSISGAGWSISRSGLLPISRREHPGASMEDPDASMAHPAGASEHPETASGYPAADVGAFARTRRPHPRTLASAPTPASQPRTRNSEPRTLPA